MYPSMLAFSSFCFKALITMKLKVFLVFAFWSVQGFMWPADEFNIELPKLPINQRYPLLGGKALFADSVSVMIAKAELPDLFQPSKPRFSYAKYPWKNNIMTTVFWVGEEPTVNNPVPNTASSWDASWSKSFGGYDDPDPSDRIGYLPKGFSPRQNPFYIALPYNDVVEEKTKDSAIKNIPWFHEAYYREGRSVLKGRWIAIRRGDKVCFGQWEDCGPFGTDDWKYVFGDKQPATTGNGGAGLDVSPAIRDYLDFRYSTKTDWRFVELYEVHDGPWKNWGDNNPFVLRSNQKKDIPTTTSESISNLYKLKEVWLKSKPN
jgi:hypothetical protein